MNDLPPQGHAVPAYFHPDDDPDGWDALARSSVALVVANVADGPGIAREASWANALSDVRDGGAHVVGYVDTGYLGITGPTTRDGSGFLDDWLAQILHDIDDWFALYGDIVTGIFFDQVTESEDGASVAPVLRRLRDHVRMHAPEAVIVLNPGVAVPASFAGLADVLVTFEGSCESYLEHGTPNGYEPLTWTPPAGQLIWHIVHHTPPSLVDRVLAISRKRGANLLYITDGGGDNPYAGLAPHVTATPASAGCGLRPVAPVGGSRRSTNHNELVTIGPGPDCALISKPMLIRTEDTIEASAEFVLQSPSRRVFLASRRRNVPRWWTGSSPQIAADWLIENNRLYAYAGSGTDWTWRPAGQVTFEACGKRSRWCMEAELLGLGDDEADAAVAFHITAPGHREYSDVARGCLRVVDADGAELTSA